MKEAYLKVGVAAVSGVLVMTLFVMHFFGREPGPAKAAALFEEAQALMRQGKIYEAEVKLDQAAQLAPEDPRYLKALADVLKSEGDFEGAMKRWLLVSELDRNSAQPLYEAGMLALRAGDRNQAGEIFGKALSRAPNDTPILYQLGYLAMVRGKYDDAARFYQRIISSSPSEPEAYRNLGFIYTQKEMLTDAEEMYRKAIEYQPNDPGLQNDFGNLLLLRNKNDEARQAFARALELKPDYSDARANLAALDRETGATPAPGDTAAPATPPASPAPPAPAPTAPLPGATAHP